MVDLAMRRIGIRFVLLILLVRILSFFTDFTYEDSRGIIGAYLEALGATTVPISTTTEQRLNERSLELESAYS